MNERTDCIMLAAGMSSRSQKWKLLLPLKGSTIIESSVKNALAACAQVTLVAGYRANELKRLFNSWNDVQTLVNPVFDRGMLSSIKTGVAAVNTKRFFIALGDMPLVTPAVYCRLLDYRDFDAVMPKYQGKIGHPLLVSRSVGDRILELDDSQTLRDALKQFPTLAIPVAEQHVLQDIDSLTDYERVVESADRNCEGERRMCSTG